MFKKNWLTCTVRYSNRNLFKSTKIGTTKCVIFPVYEDILAIRFIKISDILFKEQFYFKDTIS